MSFRLAFSAERLLTGGGKDVVQALKKVKVKIAWEVIR
jgi:hypothetical protein